MHQQVPQVLRLQLHSCVFSTMQLLEPARQFRCLWDLFGCSLNEAIFLQNAEYVSIIGSEYSDKLT